jgi:hypothetical protein
MNDYFRERVTQYNWMYVFRKYLAIAVGVACVCVTGILEAKADTRLVSEEKKLTMDKTVFDIKLGAYLKLLKDGQTLSVSDCVEIVRFVNTLDMLKEASVKKEYNEFGVAVQERLPMLITVLEMDVAKGFGYYSKKYNIYLGGDLRGHLESFYVLSEPTGQPKHGEDRRAK